MGKGDYRLLRSIKFPGLDNTYTLPLTLEIAPYNEQEGGYYYGDLVEYNGAIWKCIFSGDSDYDETPPGEFDRSYWVFFDISEMGESLINVNSWPYDPWGVYRVGDVVSIPWNTIPYICIKDTPNPAGDIQFERYFQPIDYLDTSYGTYGTIGQSLNWTYNLITHSLASVHQDNLDMLEEFDVSYDWTKVNESEDGFDYASASIRLPAGYDYIISWNYEGSELSLEYNYVPDSEPGMIPAPISRLTSVPTLFRLSGGGEILLQVSSRHRTDGDFSSDTFDSLHDKDLDYVESNLFIGRIEQQSAISTLNIDKQISQDYTEIYKDYGDQWMITNEDEDDAEYVESPPIPLDLGNISLVFRSVYSGDWDSLNVELIRYPHPQESWIEPDVQVLDINDTKIDADGFITIITSARNLQYADGQWWYATLRVSLKPEYSTTWDLSYARDVVNDGLKILRKPLTQSLPNPQRKNDSRSVNQFLNIARSYFKGEKLYNIDPTQWGDQYLPFDQKVTEPYEVSYDDFILTPFSFITLCLRGIDFNNTPYAATLEFPNYPKWEEGSVK